MEIQSENAVKKSSKLSWPLKIAGMVILGIAGAVTIAFLFGYFVMLLWNWLIVDTFGWLSEPITYWQAFGVVLLAKLLFGGHKHSEHEKFYKGGKKFHEMRCKKNHSSESYRKWRYYDEYWNNGGEEAFNEYVKQKEEGSQDVT